ncbi:glycosyltransferase family 87 protein [Novosphingobium sp.]|uniref:glycosyltransferase family 87 protein n=1 Tax=Novosphingobium sp. TaxID=1874826 RepID=UPI0033409345
MNGLSTRPGDRVVDWWVRSRLCLRTNRWPDRDRVRAVSLFMLIAYVPMCAHFFAEATGRVGSDFQAFWGAGRLVMAGMPWDAFNLAAERAAQAPAHTGVMVPFVNPPPYLLLAAPLGLMPYPAAWLVWVITGWALWFAVCRRLCPGEPLMILACPAAFLAAYHAQNGLVTGALLVAGVTLMARRQTGSAGRHADVLAGVLFGALVIKPHLALLVPLWLIAGRRWHTLGAMVLSAVAFCLVSLAVFGPATWLAYPHSFHVTAMLLTQGAGQLFLRMATPYALLRTTINPHVALAGQAVITVASASLVWRQTRQHGTNAGTGALMLAATTVASPYLFSYDLAYWVQPVLWLVTMAREAGWRAWEKPAVIALWLAPLATRAAALPLHANLLPLAGVALVAMIATRLRAPQVMPGAAPAVLPRPAR